MMFDWVKKRRKERTHMIMPSYTVMPESTSYVSPPSVFYTPPTVMGDWDRGYVADASDYTDKGQSDFSGGDGGSFGGGGASGSWDSSDSGSSSSDSGSSSDGGSSGGSD